MPQFEAYVPHPLSNDLPELLTTGSVGTPARSRLFPVFIGQNGLERSPVQVEVHDIGRGERALWQGREEQFVDHPVSRGADGTGSGRCWMGGDDNEAREAPSG